MLQQYGRAKLPPLAVIIPHPFALQGHAIAVESNELQDIAAQLPRLELIDNSILSIRFLGSQSDVDRLLMASRASKEGVIKFQQNYRRFFQVRPPSGTGLPSCHRSSKHRDLLTNKRARTTFRQYSLGSYWRE